eukprot:g3958.t1
MHTAASDAVNDIAYRRRRGSSHNFEGRSACLAWHKRWLRAQLMKVRAGCSAQSGDRHEPYLFSDQEWETVASAESALVDLVDLARRGEPFARNCVGHLLQAEEVLDAIDEESVAFFRAGSWSSPAEMAADDVAGEVQTKRNVDVLCALLDTIAGAVEDRSERYNTCTCCRLRFVDGIDSIENNGCRFVEKIGRLFLRLCAPRDDAGDDGHGGRVDVGVAEADAISNESLMQKKLKSHCMNALQKFFLSGSWVSLKVLADVAADADLRPSDRLAATEALALLSTDSEGESHDGLGAALQDVAVATDHFWPKQQCALSAVAVQVLVWPFLRVALALQNATASRRRSAEGQGQPQMSLHMCRASGLNLFRRMTTIRKKSRPPYWQREERIRGDRRLRMLVYLRLFLGRRVLRNEPLACTTRLWNEAYILYATAGQMLASECPDLVDEVYKYTAVDAADDGAWLEEALFGIECGSERAADNAEGGLDLMLSREPSSCVDVEHTYLADAFTVQQSSIWTHGYTGDPDAPIRNFYEGRTRDFHGPPDHVCIHSGFRGWWYPTFKDGSAKHVSQFTVWLPREQELARRMRNACVRLQREGDDEPSNDIPGATCDFYFPEAPDANGSVTVVVNENVHGFKILTTTINSQYGQVATIVLCGAVIKGSTKALLMDPATNGNQITAYQSGRWDSAGYTHKAHDVVASQPLHWTEGEPVAWPSKCTMTALGLDNYWTAEFTHPTFVKLMKLWNRSDGYQERLNFATVYLDDQSDVFAQLGGVWTTGTGLLIDRQVKKVTVRAPATTAGSATYLTICAAQFWIDVHPSFFVARNVKLNKRRHITLGDTLLPVVNQGAWWSHWRGEPLSPLGWRTVEEELDAGVILPNTANTTSSGLLKSPNSFPIRAGAAGELLQRLFVAVDWNDQKWGVQKGGLRLDLVRQEEVVASSWIEHAPHERGTEYREYLRSSGDAIVTQAVENDVIRFSARDQPVLCADASWTTA